MPIKSVYNNQVLMRSVFYNTLVKKLSQDYMHMALVGVRDGFISAQVSESSPSL